MLFTDNQEIKQSNETKLQPYQNNLVAKINVGIPKNSDTT